MARVKKIVKQKRPGRPRVVGGGAGATKYVGIRLPEKLKDQVDDLAKARGLELSKALREIIERGLKPRSATNTAATQGALGMSRDSQIEITPEMIEAGARTLSALDLIHFSGAREAAKLVFKEMLADSPYNLVPKSTTSS